MCCVVSLGAGDGGAAFARVPFPFPYKVWNLHLTGPASALAAYCC